MAFREITGVAREYGILELNGAYDPSPLAIPCNQYSKISFLITYEGNGSLLYKVEWSNDNVNWYQSSDSQSPVLVAGADTTIQTQRAEIEYTPTGATAESFMSPNFDVGAQFVRISCADGTLDRAQGSASVEYYMCGETE